MIGSLASPTIFGAPEINRVLSDKSAVDKAVGVAFALNHFGTSESDLKKVLAAALEKGGDYADLFFEHTYQNNLGLQDGTVNRASSNIDYGMKQKLVWILYLLYI